jgi:hypothetical protein
MNTKGNNGSGFYLTMGIEPLPANEFAAAAGYAYPHKIVNY